MSENRGDDVKNIGDAGDSTRDSLDMPEALASPVCEMVRGIKRALQCGDHQSLKMLLGKLETWRESDKTDCLHDYWRVGILCPALSWQRSRLMFCISVL